MDIERFWHIVDTAAREAGDDPDARIDALRTLLQLQSLDEIVSFDQHYEDCVNRAYRWDLWGAAFLMNCGCSDDGFRYFRDWLISQGRGTYEAALESAETLADLGRLDMAELEAFAYVALEVYEAKGGNELDRRYTLEPSEPLGQSWAEDELPQRFPKLAALYR